MNALKLMAYLGLDSSEYESGLSKAAGKATKFGKVSAAVFGAFMEVGRRAASAVFNSISTNMDGAVKRFDTLNNFPKVMESLGFEAAESSKAINDLADGIGHLPTTLDAVASQAQQIVPMTGDIEKATQVTLALNNAMAAGGKEAYVQQNAIEQWTKAMAKGKPDFEMWQSMVQAAPAQMDQLAKSIMGANANQNDLYEAMKSGSISIGEVNDKMVELTTASEGFEIAGKHYDNFAKQAENASAGIQMSIINVRAAIQRNLANVLQSADDIFGPKGIAGAIQGIVPVIDAVGSKIKQLFEINKGAEFPLLNVIGGGLRALVTSGGNAITGFLQGITGSIPRVIEQGEIILENLASSIAGQATKLAPVALNVIGVLAESLASAIPNLLAHIGDLLGSINIGADFMDKITSSIAESAPKLIDQGLQMILQFSEGLRSGVGQLVSAGLQIIVAIGNGIIAALPSLISYAPQIVTNIAGIINDNAPKVLTAGVQLIGNLIKGLVSAIPTLIANLPQIIDAIWNVFTAVNWLALGSQVVTAIGSGIKALGEALPGALKSIGQKALNAFKGISWGSVGKTAISLISKAISGLASLPGAALRKAASLGMKAFTSISWGNVGSNIIKGIVRGVTAGASMLLNSLKGLAKRALNAAKSALGIQSPSKVFRNQVGKNIALGMAKGIGDGEASVTKAMDALNGSLDAPVITPTITDVAKLPAKTYWSNVASSNERTAGSGQNIQITNYITVDGAENPEDFAERFVRQMKLDMRTA